MGAKADDLGASSYGIIKQSKEPFAADRMIATCHSLPTNGWSFLRGIVLRRSMVWLDSIEAETNHVLLGVKISIPRRQFLCRDRFFSFFMVGDQGRGENCVDTMDGRFLNDRDMRNII